VPALGSARVVEGVRWEPVKPQEPSIRAKNLGGLRNFLPEFVKPPAPWPCLPPLPITGMHSPRALALVYSLLTTPLVRGIGLLATGVIIPAMASAVVGRGAAVRGFSWAKSPTTVELVIVGRDRTERND
jgi:hypothetical protein